MDDYVPITTQTEELAALTSLLTPPGTQFAPEPEFIAPPTPTEALAAPVAAQEVPVAPPAPAPVAEAPAVPVPEKVLTFESRLNEDLQALLDEPDFDEEARIEVAAEVDEDRYEYDDPEVAARERAKDKRIQFLETQLVAKSKRGWIEEAKRAFPDLALLPGKIEGIQATSRRAFIREANAHNEEYKVILAPVIEQYKAALAAKDVTSLATAREEVAGAWGKPASDVIPASAAAQKDELDKARATGSLEKQIKVLLQDTPVL